MDTVPILLVILLLAITAFFVASEYAIVKVRSSRIDQLLSEGNRQAVHAKRILQNLDEYLSACQVGITISAIGLGWMGESAISGFFEPLLTGLSVSSNASLAISFIVVFLSIAFLHVVIGELTPKIIAVQKAERITLFVARPLTWFYHLTYPIIWFMHSAARFVARSLGFKDTSNSANTHTEEDLRLILSDSLKSGEINQNEYQYVNKIFEFDERVAKEIMVPRTEIASVNQHMTLREVFSIMKEEQFTRYPVVEDGDKDHVIGMINMKELMTAYIEDERSGDQSISSFTHPIIQVIDSIPIKELLRKFQLERMHMGILLDEYGGTSGLVTMEDIIEEIVGEIQDEFDTDEVPEVQKIADHHYVLDSKVLVGHVNDLLGITLPDEDVDTIGGWFMTKNFEAEIGNEIEEQGFIFKVRDIEGYHILYLEVFKTQEETAAGSPVQLEEA